MFKWLYTRLLGKLEMYKWILPRRISDRCYSYKIVITWAGIEIPIIAVVGLSVSMMGLLLRGIQAFLTVLSFLIALIAFSWPAAYLHEYLHAIELRKCGAVTRIVTVGLLPKSIDMDRPVSRECYLRSLRAMDRYEKVSQVMLISGFTSFLAIIAILVFSSAPIPTLPICIISSIAGIVAVTGYYLSKWSTEGDHKEEQIVKDITNKLRVKENENIEVKIIHKYIKQKHEIRVTVCRTK